MTLRAAVVVRADGVVLRASVDVDAIPAIAERGCTGPIQTDQVALDRVADRSGASDRDTRSQVARDDVGCACRRATDGITRRVRQHDSATIRIAVTDSCRMCRIEPDRVAEDLVAG